MALSRLNYNSLNVTPVANKGIGFDSGADDLSTDFAGGSITFIKKETASSSGSLTFVDGTSDVVLDNTYKEYLFIFKHIHPQTEDQPLTFQANAAGGSGYDETLTTTYFRAYHTEADTSTFGYWSQLALGNTTNEQWLNYNLGETDPEVAAGELYLFAPASTTYAKQFISRSIALTYNISATDAYVGGYINSSSAVNAIRFGMWESTSSSQNIKNGTIKMYGLL